MREKRIISQDRMISLPFDRTELYIEEGEESAKIIAKCGPKKYSMWEGTIEDAKTELQHTTDYAQYFYSFVYRIGVKTEKKNKEKAQI